MDIPNDIFITFVVLAFAIGGMGLWLGVKRIAGAPFICVFAGIILFSQIAFIEDIQYFGVDGNDGITEVWNQQLLTGQNTIHNGTGNVVIRAEHLTTSSSQLFGKTVNCMTLSIGKTGSPQISFPVILGVFSTTVSNSIAETKYEFGRVNVTNLTVDKMPFKRCNLVTDYTLITGDRVGLMYRDGDASNFITINENSQNPFDGTITVVSSFNDATNTWSNANSNDIAQITLTLEKSSTPDAYRLSDNDTWAFFMLFGLFFVMMGALIQWR